MLRCTYYGTTACGAAASPGLPAARRRAAAASAEGTRTCRACLAAALVSPGSGKAIPRCSSCVNSSCLRRNSRVELLASSPSRCRSSQVKAGPSCCPCSASSTACISRSAASTSPPRTLPPAAVVMPMRRAASKEPSAIRCWCTCGVVRGVVRVCAMVRGGVKRVVAGLCCTACATSALGMRSRGSSTWEAMVLSIPLPSLVTAAFTALW
eukprot:scaffold94302_cov37-Phaeocystis_antarctica.AAC.1